MQVHSLYVRRRNKWDQINISASYGTSAWQDSRASKCTAVARIPTGCEHLLYSSHKPYQTSRRDILDFWYIQYCFQVISIPLIIHWKVLCFHWAGVCHVHVVPFCTWMGVAGPFRKGPAQSSWTPRDTTTPFPAGQCTQKLVQHVSFLLTQGFKVRYTFRKWG